ncbi:uncharacterized protein GGS22DRAFT_136864 [Annulohypoxylon maeteangense]|uniref:uncharacterized protein n=1 Tax=Annulohypoxylon maeteangense TaxID=1927788 RepID=UPI002007665C|nr:uncharacterized protein GGS22DRAFT_136864 [Annulohypoxylon maeteangense]KAI0884986.1 hypothetical protein GGS22DRAFT_136864 [Annulohypoxylon maeteangense]
MSSPAEPPNCELIEGNPDFYGLGIRIGVYLQWITAWVSLLVDPLSAQSVYDVNSVFVFAILVATMIATFANSPTIQPIETYIMLQFCLGFFVTTLSTFGLRLHLLRPSSVAELLRNLDRLKRAVRASLQDSTWFSVMWRIARNKIKLPLNYISPLKPYHLSWSGVFWRTTTVCVLTAVNIWLWFASQPNYRLANQTCDPPFVFFFSRQQLDGAIVGFFKTVSIFILIIVILPFLVLFQLTIRIMHNAIMALYRDLLHYMIPEAPQRLKQPLDRINSIFNSFGLDPATLSQFTGSFDVLDFLSKPSEETYRFSDVLKLIVYLGRGKDGERRVVEAQAKSGNTPPYDRAYYLNRRFCLLWNVYVVLSIIWFILSIEFTLSWNNIQGVNSIDSAGQLIPFVIGAVSTLQVMKKVILLGLSKKYDDGVEVTVDASIDLVGTQGTFKILKTRSTLENKYQGDFSTPRPRTGPENALTITDNLTAKSRANREVREDNMG